MFESVMTQLQRTLYRTVFNNLQNLLTGNHSTSTAGGQTLRARASDFDNLFVEVARRYDLDPTLLKAVAQVESNFSAQAISHAGAKGLMQLMDTTAQVLGVENVFDPAQNIDGGARYLKEMLNRYHGDLKMALAAYNAGPGAVDRWGSVPPYQETQAYIPRVLGLQQQYHNWLA